MCGICGIIRKNDNVDLAQLDQMLTFLAERGPETKRTFLNGNTGLGHTRLSIIDLSSAAYQPFIHDVTLNVITFNGEIYNFKTLRNELEILGAKFKSNSDTEVVLEAYQRWGINKTLTKLDGMFAFGIYDHSTKTIFLARDRFGKKPLYYLKNENSVYFSSDIRSIWATNRDHLTIDWNSIDY